MAILIILGLYLAAIVGIGLRFVLAWGYDITFTIKQNFRQLIMAGAVMLPFSLGAFFINTGNYVLTYFVLAGGGFLTKYIVEQGNKIKG